MLKHLTPTTYDFDAPQHAVCEATSASLATELEEFGLKRPRSPVIACLGACVGLIVTEQLPGQPAPGPDPADDSANPSAPRAAVRRWVGLQAATANLRYRFVDNSDGVVRTAQVQYRFSLRGTLNFDRAQRFVVDAGAFTGSRFSSGWDNTWLGRAEFQDYFNLKGLSFTARPVVGVEAQVGGLYMVRGRSTEFTTYDEDGFVMGERLSVRRPRDLWFDEISLTGGYITFDPTRMSVFDRFSSIDDQNYWQVVVQKTLGPRLSFSADFTREQVRDTWRQAATVALPEARVIDGFTLEIYERTNAGADQGFALTFSKQLTSRLSLNQFGYAEIDPSYGPQNADRLNVGKRIFGMVTFNATDAITTSLFVTTAVGGNGTLPQRTLLNAVLGYNLVPVLRRIIF